MFQSRLISKRAKLKFYYSVIRPIITYSCETWILKETIINKLMVFERKIFRKIFGPNNENGIWRIQTNQELGEIIKRKNTNFSRSQRLSWLGRSHRKDARYENGKGNILLETHLKTTNRKTKDTMGGCC
jgi:hypothetical protein